MKYPFMGLDGFYWWQGVVESVADPLELGQVQVRLFAIHSSEKVPDDESGQGIPTENLPWASVSSDITSACTSGFGESPVGLVEGSHVWGFSRDGRDYSDLVVCGSYVGIPKSMSNGKGFEDPNMVYPTRINESDLHRLSRGVVNDTWVQRLGDSIRENRLFVEPGSTFKAKYPMNHVIHTRSGHTFERDDTPEAERISMVHKSGTYYEMHPNGTRAERITKDRYSVVVGDDFLEVSGQVRIYVKGDVTQSIDGNVVQYVEGNVNEKVKGNMVADVEGSVSQKVTQNVIQKVGGNVNEKIDGNRVTECSGQISMKASKVIIDAPIETSSTIKSSGDMHAGDVSVQKHTHKYKEPLHVKKESENKPSTPTVSAVSPNGAAPADALVVAKLPDQVPSPTKISANESKRYEGVDLPDQSIVERNVSDDIIHDEAPHNAIEQTEALATDQPWITEAKRNMGVAEIPGAPSNPDIIQYWVDIRRSGITSDSVPWCAAFVGAMLERVGIQSTRFEGARSYSSFGKSLDKPAYGCIAVFSRGVGGHVGFVIGEDTSGKLIVLGGNQSDKVKVSAFAKSRVVAYRFPEGYEVPEGMPTISAGGSVKEV